MLTDAELEAAAHGFARARARASTDELWRAWVAKCVALFDELEAETRFEVSLDVDDAARIVNLAIARRLEGGIRPAGHLRPGDRFRWCDCVVEVVGLEDRRPNGWLTVVVLERGEVRRLHYRSSETVTVLELEELDDRG